MTKLLIALQEISSEQFFIWRKKELSKGGSAEDLDWLLDLEGGLNWSTLQRLYIDPKSSVELSNSLEHLAKLWRRHVEENIPLQYLIGRCPWRDFELEVNSSVLIPRQETELLIDFALQRANYHDQGRWADLGTGSGALAVALARSLPNWLGHAVEISQQALELAEKNLKVLVPDAPTKMHLGSWWEPLKPWWGRFDLVVANPPYIPYEQFQALEPVVRDHEPQLALYGGRDGLDSCRKVIAGALVGLRPGGWLILEHHHDHSEHVMTLMRKAGLLMVSYENDLNGIKRFAIGRNPFKES